MSLLVPDLVPAVTAAGLESVAAPMPPVGPVPSAGQKRAAQPLLAAVWSRAALAPALPLVWPVQPDLPPSPKTSYRSAYRPPGPAEVPDPADWERLSDFELALALIDFSPLERLLARLYKPSARGQVPFHPVSLLLAVCLRRELGLSWRALARLLAGPHGAGWRARFGFAEGVTPSASGLRSFFARLDPALVAGLCPQLIALLRQHRLCPERSTVAGDPPARGVTVSQDGMLHPARHRPSCQLATDACYRPLPEPAEPAAAEALPVLPPAASPPSTDELPVLPSGSVGRPCRARERGREGCACDTDACQQQCRRASHLDPAARFIHYAGRRPKPSGAPPAPAGGPTAATGQGTDVFGYRSVAERLIDDRFAVAWTLQSSLYPANTDERTIFVERLAALRASFPDLKIGEWLDDSGVGYGDCLEAIWDLGALRMVDPRADPTDADPAACLARGYDGHGRPLCPHGYRLRANGYDAERRRAKYVCAQACGREPRRAGEPVAPVADCPYRDPDRPVGFVVNVGKTLPDGSLRLAREIPYGSPQWRARSGRRNLSESRNGQLEGLGLKRLPQYGLARNTKEVQLADCLLNLHTLGRLVRQATALTRA